MDDTRARWLSIPARADGVGGRAMTERLPDPQVRERERERMLGSQPAPAFVGLALVFPSVKWKLL